MFLKKYLFVGVLTLGAQLTAFAGLTGCESERACAPVVGVAVGGQLLPLGDFVASIGNGLYFGSVSDIGTEADPFIIQQLSVASSPDPFIDYGFSVKNNTDVALDFVFVFSSPFVGGPYNVLGSAHGGNLINGTGAGGTDDTVALLPFGQANVHQPFIVGIGDVNGLNTGCAAEVGSPGSLACPVAPDPSVSVTPIATGATGVFGVRVQFTLSPGDLYAANGRIELATSGDPVVPEPGTYALLASGLIGIVAVARRRRAA